MLGEQRAGRILLIGLIAGALLATACFAPRSGTRRGPIDLGGIFGASTQEGGRNLGIEVPTCNGDPIVTTLEQTPDVVRIQVVSTEQLGAGDDCLDSVQVTLDAPLGDRPVIDLTSGAELEVEVGSQR